MIERYEGEGSWVLFGDLSLLYINEVEVPKLRKTKAIA